MATSRRTDRCRDWWPAAILATWNVASAPLLTEYLVEPLRDGLGVRRFVLLLAAGFVIATVAVGVAAVRRMQADRPRRMAWIALALGLVVAFELVSDRGLPQERVVERLHFLSYGGLAALLAVPWRSLRAWAPLGALVSAVLIAVVDEFVQWWVPVRVGEFFDLGLNLYAAACGALIGLGLFSVGWPSQAVRIGWRPEAAAVVTREAGARAWQRLALLSAVLVLAAATFVQVAQLGHQIDDPEIGRFLSFHSEAELRRADAAARQRWTAQAPGDLTPFEKEDWYRSEAGWHTLERNRAYEEEDWWTVDRENAILEEYFGAFLDTSDRGGSPRRFTDEAVHNVRLLAEERRSQAERFESRAGDGRIWLWPPAGLLWASAGALALVLAWAAARARRRAVAVARPTPRDGGGR